MKAKVLVVESNTTYLSMARGILMRLGYSVVMAGSYKAVIDLMADQESADVEGIIINLFLPKESRAGSGFAQPCGLGLVANAVIANMPVAVCISKDNDDFYLKTVIATLSTLGSYKTKEIPYITENNWLKACEDLHKIISKKKD